MNLDYIRRSLRLASKSDYFNITSIIRTLMTLCGRAANGGNRSPATRDVRCRIEFISQPYWRFYLCWATWVVPCNCNCLFSICYLLFFGKYLWNLFFHECS